MKILKPIYVIYVTVIPFIICMILSNFTSNIRAHYTNDLFISLELDHALMYSLIILFLGLLIGHLIAFSRLSKSGKPLAFTQLTSIKYFFLMAANSMLIAIIITRYKPLENRYTIFTHDLIDYTYFNQTIYIAHLISIGYFIGYMGIITLLFFTNKLKKENKDKLSISEETTTSNEQE